MHVYMLKHQAQTGASGASSSYPKAGTCWMGPVPNAASTEASHCNYETLIRLNNFWPLAFSGHDKIERKHEKWTICIYMKRHEQDIRDAGEAIPESKRSITAFLVFSAAFPETMAFGSTSWDPASWQSWWKGVAGLDMNHSGVPCTLEGFSIDDDG